MKFLMLLYIAILLSIAPASVIACQCGTPPPPCYAYWESDAVFVGKITKIHKFKEGDIPSLDKVEVDVEKNHKGMPFKTAFTYNLSHSCAWNFEEGERFLFYASVGKEKDSFFGTGLCTRTGIIQENSNYENSADYKFFKQLESATPNYQIWGMFTQNKYKPFAGITAEVFDNSKWIRAISNEYGVTELPVSKIGNYKFRVFLPHNYLIFPSEQMIDRKIPTKANLDAKNPYVEFKLEVKNNKCGWVETDFFPDIN